MRAVVLGSDGFWETMPPQEVKAQLEGHRLEEAGARLLEGRRKDDSTLIILQLKSCSMGHLAQPPYPLLPLSLQGQPDPPQPALEACVNSQ
jgi:hypothetical protein